jgi:hypothetical protein
MSIRRRRGCAPATMRDRESCDRDGARLTRVLRVESGGVGRGFASTRKRTGPTSRITATTCSSDRAAASASTQRRRQPRLKARALRKVDGGDTGHDANGLPPTRRPVNSCDSRPSIFARRPRALPRITAFAIASARRTVSSRTDRRSRATP